MNNWKVYIIYCSDHTLYTGITTDIKNRYQQHAQKMGAKYFRARQPKELVYLEFGHNRSTATIREMKIKKLSRGEKIKLISSNENQIKTVANVLQNVY